MVGTYTKKSSQGIYSLTLDTNSKELTNIEPIIEAGSPTYLGISNANRCYCVDKVGNQGGVSSFDLNATPASKINQILSNGSAPAYIGIDEKRQLVYAGNYHLSTVTVFKIQSDGSLLQTDKVTHQGLTGPKPEQDKPHVHYCDLTPDNRLVVCDLGMDLTFIYDVSNDGKLIAKSRYQSEAGFGPRHIVFHPNGKIAYLVGELGSKIEVLKYNDSNAQFTKLQTISTIPEDWTTHNGAAAIHISNDGKFVYASNRGQNALVVFEVQSDFTIKLVQTISTEGDFPRDFELSQNEDFVICANQNTDNLTLYERNTMDGTLSVVQKNVACPEGVCIKKWLLAN